MTYLEVIERILAFNPQTDFWQLLQTPFESVLVFQIRYAHHKCSYAAPQRASLYESQVV